MAYSTSDQLKSNVKLIEGSFSGSALTDFISDRIAQADKIVKVDIARFVDIDLIPATGDSPATPDFVNLLSQYKAAEMSLVRIGSAKRKANEFNDIQYWQAEYQKLLERIKSGAIDLILSDDTNIATGVNTGSFTNEDVKPRFGYDEYGDFADTDRLEDIRNEEVDGYAGD